MQVLEGEVCFHDASGLDPGPEHVLLRGHINGIGYPVQVIQIAAGKTGEEIGQMSGHSGSSSVPWRKAITTNGTTS